MEIFQKNKKVFLLIAVFAVVIIGYELISSGSKSTAGKSSSNSTVGGLVTELSQSPTSQADAIIGKELLALLTSLKAITLDITFFSKPVFLSLDDKSQTIEKQPLGKSLGRSNPFSDFVKVAIATSTSSATKVPLSAFGSTKTR
ncbi:MAG: hypothetical protein EXS46_03665 [Candidatus Taylorbacteria bacterium]|nr:hypothetical protein [Candidatus Taylorbacteria bacterium]